LQEGVDLRWRRDTALHYGLTLDLKLPAGNSSVVTISVATIAGAVGAESSAPKAAIRLWTGFIDVDGSSANVTAIQSRNGSFSFIGFRHFDEPKASGSTAIAVRHNAGSFHGSEIFKHGAKSFIRRPKTEVSYKYVFHVFTFTI